MRRYASGLVVGRFDPPHLGHSFLVEQVAEQCDEVVVYVNSGPRDAVPGKLRAGWLAELHPEAEVVEIVHDLPTDWGDQSLWQQWIDLFRDRWPLPAGPDVVCSSDPYVTELASRLGAAAWVVDGDRVQVPVSASMVRTDPAGNLHRLAPPVRAWVEENWL